MTDNRDDMTAADRAVLGIIGDLLKQSGLKMPELPKTTTEGKTDDDI